MRLTDRDDRRRLAYIAAAASVIFLAWITLSRADPAPAQCAPMSFGQLAARVDLARANYRRLLLAYRRAPRAPLESEAFVSRDLEFLETASRCLKAAQQRVNRLQNGGLP